MLELEDARKRILAAISPLPGEVVPLGAALGRVAHGRVESPVDLPLFDNSAMDGYAVRASDTASASSQAPVSLKCRAQISAGDAVAEPVEAGFCVRVFTGSILPPGADAVVMQEDTRTEPGRPDAVLVLESVKPWENIRLRGEDLKLGAELVRPGDRISTGQIGVLAAAGFSEIRVGRQPLLGLLATGNELLEAGQPLSPGRIYESNRTTLAALAPRVGAIPRIFPVVQDDAETTRAALAAALQECDGVVTTGGVSVGAFDFVKAAFEKLGGRLDFWKVSIKPGKPFVFGQRREKLFFGLPGNPVSALVTFLLLVRPALLRWQGATDCLLPVHPGILAERLANPGERRHFMRVVVDEGGNVRSAGVQASHILSSLANANGFVDVPARTIWEVGKAVSVLRWNW